MSEQIEIVAKINKRNIKIENLKISRQLHFVLELFDIYGPVHCQTLTTKSGLRARTISGRACDLMKIGLLEKHSKEVNPMTCYPSYTYKLTARGKKFVDMNGYL